jgi:hypothetical protein
MLRNRLKKKIDKLKKAKKLAEHLAFIYALALIIIMTAVLQSRASYKK